MKTQEVTDGFPTLCKGWHTASAAFQVGYESPSQFSREYSRHFGAPPKRDIESLRHLADDANARQGMGSA